MGSLSVMANGKDKGKSAVGNGKPLDIVFCVDLSGSTNGLINDLRDNLWMIINQAQHMEPKPALRIGFASQFREGECVCENFSSAYSQF